MTRRRIPVVLLLGLASLVPITAWADAPSITAISPDRGAVGATVLVTGTGLTAATAVAFNGVPATFTQPSGSEIDAVVPAGALTGSVTVEAHGAPTSPTPFTVQPDIVLILTDDQRFDETAFMPTVTSQLVDKGITFDRGFVVNPQCCPSRTTILTGAYSHTTDVYRNTPPHGGFAAFHSGAEASTIAVWLQNAGYRTGIVGKYLNGYGQAQTSWVAPGWDQWRVLAAPGNGGYYDYWLSIDGVPKYRGATAADYSTDVLGKDAVNFIDATSPGVPLFLYFAPKSPHSPTTAAPRYANACPGLPDTTSPSFNEADVSDKPAYIRQTPLLNAVRQSHTAQCRSLLAVDDAVGSILAALDRSGRLTNSLIVFMSDNGVQMGEHRVRGKQVPYESSIHVPLIVRYDALSARVAPAVDHHLALNMDLAPTFAEAGGTQAPGAEGSSLLPFLSGASPPWRSDFLIEHFGVSVPTYCAVRNRQYKYVEYQTGEQELYDLVNDPYELQNQAGNQNPPYPRILASMHRRMVELCNPPPPGFTP